jgi:predicted CopG family antitoxin
MKMITRMKMAKIRDDTHEDLKNMGRYGDSMADIIGRCVEFYKEKSKKHGAS